MFNFVKFSLMYRYALLIQYDGSQFFGFQFQKNEKSVQGFLEETIGIFTRHPTRIHAAGRTDTGVHAIGQVVHFDTPHDLNTHALAGCINAYGREQGVSVIDIQKVDHDFHARFSAKAREYIYLIRNHTYPSTLMATKSYHVYAPLDLSLMEEGASKLIGTHDFESFRSTKCQAKNAIRSIDFIRFEKYGDYIKIHLRARSFLHNQVRITVGCLTSIGKGEHPPTWIDDLLEAKNRTVSGITAPAHGLYFYHVDYDMNLFQAKGSTILMG